MFTVGRNQEYQDEDGKRETSVGGHGARDLIILDRNTEVSWIMPRNIYVSDNRPSQGKKNKEWEVFSQGGMRVDF